MGLTEVALGLHIMAYKPLSICCAQLDVVSRICNKLWNSMFPAPDSRPSRY
jgi:hypothetical protein